MASIYDSVKSAVALSPSDPDALFVLLGRNGERLGIGTQAAPFAANIASIFLKSFEDMDAVNNAAHAVFHDKLEAFRNTLRQIFGTAERAKLAVLANSLAGKSVDGLLMKSWARGIFDAAEWADEVAGVAVKDAKDPLGLGRALGLDSLTPVLWLAGGYLLIRLLEVTK